jgi:hypothetical protein
LLNMDRCGRICAIMAVLVFSKAEEFPAAVVVRGLLTPGHAFALHERAYPDAVVLGKGSHIPGIKEARNETKRWTSNNLGALCLGGSIGRVIKPLNYRKGGIPLHIDNYDIINSTSVNLGNGFDEPTTFYAERIADATARYGDIDKTAIEREAADVTPAFSVELEPGDAAIISRGVHHMVTASRDRSTLVLGTSSLLTP